MSFNIDGKPISFLLAKWYGYIFAFFYILYGGVTIVLGVLDRTYGDISQAFILLLFGAALMVITIAFKDKKLWGWYGLIGINSLVILLAIFSLSKTESLVLLVLSIIALGALLIPPTKDIISKQS